MAAHWSVVTLDAAAWTSWSVAVSYRGARWSAEAVGADSAVTRLRRWELGGRCYTRVGVRRWRAAVPDAGRLFGGRPRRLLRRLDPADWEALAAETRRAERVHWRILAALPVILLWNRGVLVPAMVGYAAAANIPCLALQRYNRARVAALLARRSRPRQPTATPRPRR